MRLHDGDAPWCRESSRKEFAMQPEAGSMTGLLFFTFERFSEVTTVQRTCFVLSLNHWRVSC